MDKKTLGERFDVVGNRISILYGLFVGVSGTLFGAYLYLSPSVVATGKHFEIELPGYSYQKPMTEEERKKMPIDWGTIYDGPNYRESWHITIQNKSKATLKDLKIEMPVDGDYKLDGDELKSFAKNIDLGSLTGYSKLRLKIWSSHVVFAGTPNDYRVSHEDGSEQIYFPPELTANDYWILYISKWILWLFFIVGGGWCIGKLIKSRGVNLNVPRRIT